MAPTQSCIQSGSHFKFNQHSQGHLQQVSELKRSRSLGYVAPANHPAPFDNRVVAGSLPQYEKVVHKEKK